MGNFVGQSTSANVVCGPFIDISGSVIPNLAIANTAIVLIKENAASAARSQTTSAASIGPGMYRIVLNSADTNTLGTLTIVVSASACLPYAKDIEIWQAATHALYYGSADQVLGSAAVSVMVSVIVQAALVNYDVPTSADLSVAISVGVQAALTNYDVATSGDVSAIFAGVGGGLTSAQVSAIVIQALTQYDVPTSADVSAITVGVLTGYDVPTSADISVMVSVGVNAALSNFGVPTSAGMSAMTSAVMVGVLTNYDVPTSADISVLVSVGVNTALGNFGVPTSAAMSAAMSAVGAGVLANYDVPTSADVSAITAGVLTNYDVPTSADVSAIVSAVVSGVLASYGVPTSAAVSAMVSAITSAVVGPAVWNRSGSEPVSAPEWTSVNRGQLVDWMGARAVNRHDQTATKIEIFTSAGAAIASASAGDDGVTARRDRFSG